MTAQLPRHTDVTDDPQSLAENMRDILLFLETWPEVELLKFESQANVPFQFKTTVTDPRVVVFRAYETKNPGASVTPEIPSWTKGDPGQIRINGLDGLTAGTGYTVHALIWGA